MDKYSWLPSESAPEIYPMRIIDGLFVLNDGSTIYIPSSEFIVNGWGEIGSTHIVGDKLKPLPIKLDLIWFSFVEDKFYGGTFALPGNKINDLFGNGFQSSISGKNVTYNRIIVGMAPEGEISVWLEAEGEVLEVATFKAKEVSGNWKSVLGNEKISRKDYLESVLEEFLSEEQVADYKQNGIGKGMFENYKGQYTWDLEVVGSKPLFCWVKNYNGECEFTKLPFGETVRTRRSVPKVITLNWENKSGITYTAKITPDEKEIFKAYQKISSNDFNHKMKLRIYINEMYNSIDVFLKDSQFILKLEKSDIKVHRTN
jgi:hypothetical protein